jgi:hypothetical protein
MVSSSHNHICPLCSSAASPYVIAHARTYLRCTNCELVFMDDAHHLPTLTERQRYESHRNSPNDPAYRAYLNAAVEPLLAVLKPGACGLDFGCGPGPPQFQSCLQKRASRYETTIRSSLLIQQHWNSNMISWSVQRLPNTSSIRKHEI